MKKIALGQMNIEYGNIQRNVKTATDFLRAAIAERCDLLLLPELWSTGFELRSLEEYSQQNMKLIKQLQSLSDQSNITICGSFIENQNGRFYNSFNTIQPHQPVFTYHKKHLFQLMHEDKYFKPGIESVPFSSSFGKTGMAICFDLRFPEFFRDLSAQGVELYLLTAHWPLIRIDHWDVLLRARAIENQAFMIAVNSAGESGRDVYGGHSTVIAPDGEILIQAPSDEENLFITEIDPALAKLQRENFIIQR